MQRECPICGKIYEAAPANIKRGKQLTCSRECSIKLRKSKKPRPDHCPHCGSSDIVISTSTKSTKEDTRFICNSCKRSFYDRPLRYYCLNPEKGPMTAKERMQRFLKKKRERSQTID